MSTLHQIPAFKDNYIWLIETEDKLAYVVDPGEARGVLSFLNQHALELAGIFITHHHTDHTGGVAELMTVKSVPVYGPSEASVCTHIVADGDVLNVSDLGTLQVIGVPGHTLGHIAFYNEKHQWLFCGDTLFSAGCGRVFEGTYEQMFHSLQKLAKLPANTQICCAHEYTQSNINFALAVEPNNLDLQKHAQNVIRLRAEGHPTVPTSLSLELLINPFLRCNVNALKDAASQKAGKPLNTDVEVFTQIREWKNNF